MFLFTCSLAHVGCDMCCASSGWGWSQAQPTWGFRSLSSLLLLDAFQNILKRLLGYICESFSGVVSVVEFLGAHVSFPDNTLFP